MDKAEEEERMRECEEKKNKEKGRERKGKK